MFETFHPSKLPLTPYLFFTGKGGVGKTSTASATAIALADKGKNILLVSTDPASNLQDVFEMELTNDLTNVETVPNLSIANLDPEEAARIYREKAISPYRETLPSSVLETMEEQMSGACTVEIAAFDAFTSFLSDNTMLNQFDHIIFDTAPTGHTLRLLQLPAAWSGFIAQNENGASCLGPLSALDNKKKQYDEAVSSLSYKTLTTLCLVTRPDETATYEAERASIELSQVGITNQILLMNGVHDHYLESDHVSTAFYDLQQNAIQGLSDYLKKIPTYSLPLVPYSLTGVENLQNLFTGDTFLLKEELNHFEWNTSNGLDDAINTFSTRQTGIIFTMGKGGVGKTTVASTVAQGLVARGHRVHLTTTDPADHLNFSLKNQEKSDRLVVSNLDPKKVVEEYKREVLSEASDSLSEDELAYLKEDLESPCTEEIAVFRAFADIVESSSTEFVVIDTAPTGHTLLLLDAAKAYHNEIQRSSGNVPDAVKHLLPKLRDPNETQILIVTLPEATPFYEAKRLQEDLLRADLHPTWWIVNQSFYMTNTSDPILKSKALSEIPWMNQIERTANRMAIIPWQT
ncbi:arsenical pump-driving ATPase [Pseudalkalibacillus hwajinpoensis]|uniref:arsenical pump-driving ATPase n=1 Tax=Guptibacillus hwajinpoensis TaxID=208199 RepID=UPI00325AACCF